MTGPAAEKPQGDIFVSWWEDEGGRIAERLHGISALLVVGSNGEHAARVALGIARAESLRRHVALGDLIGDLEPLYAVAGGDDAFGLSDCLRQQLPLNDIARPAPDRESLFILPAGSPPVSSEDVIAHERWPKLVNGFAKAGALLVLVCSPDAPGLGTLEAATGGVVLVETAAGEKFPASARVLAKVAAPVVARAADTPASRRSAFWKAMLIFDAIVLVAAAGWFAWHGRGSAQTAAPVGAGASAAVRPVLAAPSTVPTAAMPLVDTVRLTDPVNPADTASTVPFAVEVMAANTLAGANSFLSDIGDERAFPSATVSRVTVGSSSNVWYKVVVGASHNRAGADSILASLRRAGLLHKAEGRVVKVPYALLLADKVDRSAALASNQSWQKRGFNPYLLVQNDGTVRVLAGAFETMAQAAPLASALHAAGVAPVLAFRTGRMY